MHLNVNDEQELDDISREFGYPVDVVMNSLKVNIIATYKLLDLPNQNCWNVLMLTEADQMKNYRKRKKYRIQIFHKLLNRL